MAVRAYSVPAYQKFFHLEPRVIDVTAWTSNWWPKSGTVSSTVFTQVPVKQPDFYKGCSEFDSAQWRTLPIKERRFPTP
jgi:hypothetical protein